MNLMCNAPRPRFAIALSATLLLSACAEQPPDARPATLIAKDGLQDAPWFLREAQEAPSRQVRIDVAERSLRLVADDGSLVTERPIGEHVDVVLLYNPLPGQTDCTPLNWTDRPWQERWFLLLEGPSAATRAWAAELARDGIALPVFEVDACLLP